MTHPLPTKRRQREQLRAKQRPRPVETWKADRHEITQEIPMMVIDPEPRSIGGDFLFGLACVVIGGLIAMAIVP